MRPNPCSLASLTLLLGLFGTLAAQDAKGPDMAKGEAPPLTKESLPSLLRKLGYEPKVIGKNGMTHELEIDSNGFKTRFTVSVSNDLTRLWLVASFRKLVDIEAVPAPALLKLLAWNGTTAPFHFVLDEKTSRIYLQGSWRNEGIDSAVLNTLIEDMAGHIKRTAPDWRYEALQPPLAVVDGPEAGKERKKFLGNWTVESLEEKGNTKRAANFKGYGYEFEGTACKYGSKDKKRFLLTIDPRTTPGEVDFRIHLGLVERGIYKLEADTLTLCIDPTGKNRPKKFEAPEGSTTYLMTLKRQKP